MTRARLTLLVALGGLAAGLVLWAAGEPPLSRAEWRLHQARWNAQARRGGRPALTPGVRSVRGALGGEERCASCHLGAVHGAGRGAAAGGRSAPPLAGHPPIPCALTPGRAGVGCVVCHGGDGLRASPASLAHARRLDLGARDPDERRRRLEAGCAGCHERPGSVLGYDERVVPEVASGLRLYLEEGCPACHRLARVYRATDGGPSLDGVGARRTREQLLLRLRQPQRDSPSSPMPPSTREAHELGALVSFLLARRGSDPASARSPGLGDHFPKDGLELSAASPARGALWARRLGCVGCHRLGDADGGVPDLRLVGWYASGEELLLALREPGRRFPGGHMPRYELELPGLLTASLLDYLALQRAPLPSAPEEVLRGVCLRCHGPAGVRDPKAVVLSRGAGRSAPARGATASLPPARWPPPLSPAPPRERFLEAVLSGRKGSAMAPWGRALSRGFIESLHAALGTLGDGRPR
jgi:mono/diheme cytochrome c family protein